MQYCPMFLTSEYIQNCFFGHRSQVQLAFKKFLHSWQRFYDANRGEIPVECQAGRQLVGLEAQQTRLAKIEDGSLLPLRSLG